MKFVICSFLFIVLIVDNKAEDSEEGEFSDLEDFADWELIRASDEQTQKPESKKQQLSVFFIHFVGFFYNPVDCQKKSKASHCYLGFCFEPDRVSNKLHVLQA